MTYTLLKILISALLIVAIAELAKRSSMLAAILASIPLVSVLAMVWLYIDTHDIEKVSELSSNIIWFVLPSLVLFISLPLLLKQGLNFYWSLLISIGLTALAYAAMLKALKSFGITL